MTLKPSIKSERRLLQMAILILSSVPMGAGLQGMIEGASMTGAQGTDLSLDSHVRYLSGLLFAIGLSFLAMIPTIENRTGIVRILTFLVFIGGLSRLSGIILMGWPDEGMIFGLIMELIVTPLLCLWQARISRLYNVAF